MTYATASDVTMRWAKTPDTETAALIDVRLDDVERMLKKRIPDLDDQITAGEVDEADVIQVEADVVLRLVRNPDGYSSETDGTYGYTFSREMAFGRLEITPEDWATLGVVSGVGAELVPTFSDAPATPVHPFMMGG